jgi:hypothetical protein
MTPHVKSSHSIPGADRLHYVHADDVRIVLSRLPFELWQGLRTVHFNDRSRGARVFGYVNNGRREIALCALPPRLASPAAFTAHDSPLFRPASCYRLNVDLRCKIEHSSTWNADGQLCGKAAVAECANCWSPICQDCLDACCGENFCEYCADYHRTHYCVRKPIQAERRVANREQSA